MGAAPKDDGGPAAVADAQGVALAPPELVAPQADDEVHDGLELDLDLDVAGGEGPGDDGLRAAAQPALGPHEVAAAVPVGELAGVAEVVEDLAVPAALTLDAAVDKLGGIGVARAERLEVEPLAEHQLRALAPDALGLADDGLRGPPGAAGWAAAVPALRRGQRGPGPRAVGADGHADALDVETGVEPAALAALGAHTEDVAVAHRHLVGRAGHCGRRAADGAAVLGELVGARAGEQQLGAGRLAVLPG